MNTVVHRKRCGARGSSLLEILIAMVVVSIGLLGYTLLMMKAQKYNRTAYYRSIATIIANNITEAAQANRKQLGFYVMTDVKSTSTSGTTASGLTEPALSDISALRAALSDIPDGEANITHDAASQKFVVKISWADSDGTSTEFSTDTWIKTAP